MNDILSVSDLTKIVKKNFERYLNKCFTIEGEVQNVTDKGACYFALKDLETKTTLSCIIWQKTYERNNYSLKVGDIITVRGKLSVYEVKNSYSLSVFNMIKEETKETEFQKKFEYFKKKGYFDNKKSFDIKNIKKIGLITSIQGQAINDFKKTLSGRFFPGDIYIYNVKVQGVNCATDVIKAIDFFEKSKKYNVDMILITRGGGSTIDMDEFNNIELIERIHKRKKVIICAIGHEKDMCLCDYICDLRSSTPTSLALEISKDISEIDNKIKLVYENEKYKFEKAKNEILYNITEKKNKLLHTIMQHKPNGFYFNNNFVNTLREFKNLSKETFRIKLEDGIIEFNINDYNIIEKFNKKYTYSQYMKEYNNFEKIEIAEKEHSKFNKYLKKYQELEKKNKFGTKEHYNEFKRINNMISYYIDKIEELSTIKRKLKNFEIEKLDTYEKILKYKKHLNYLEKIFTNNFKGCKLVNLDYKDITEIYLRYINYPVDGRLTEYYIGLYLGLKKMKPKYYKIKN